ncbi:MAG: cupin domain-containing protein [Candidatus Heimdallarchaeota archaeon]|nr:cupin domain-containing protein [Candidatus Heimdallarchaeota archaeon]
MPYHNLNNQEEKELAPGFAAKFIHSDKMTISYITIKAGASVPDHNHFHEQITTIIEGEFEFNINGEMKLMSAGECSGDSTRCASLRNGYH